MGSVMFRNAVVAAALLLAAGLAADEGPNRPKIYGITSVRLKSSDFQKASETHSKILGPGAGKFTGTNGCTNVKDPCYLVNARQHIELVPGHPGDPGFWLEEIGFETASARVMRDSLLNHGVEVSELKTAPNGSPLIKARDPEGNHIAFVQPPRAPSESAPGPTQASSSPVYAGFAAKDLHPL